MNSDRLWLFNAINLFINDALNGRYAGDENYEQGLQAFGDIVVSTAMILERERAAGMPDCSAAFDALFELSLEGCDPEFYANAHELRDMVLKHAAMTVLFNSRRRGDDPACCDPGGGMRSPHEIEEDEQF